MNYKKYRVGNPVIVDGKGTFIKELPNSYQGSISGYIVYGDPFIKHIGELSPVPINDDFLKLYKSHKAQDPTRTFYSFIGNGNVVEYFPETKECVINGKAYGKLDGVHELINIIHDKCGHNFSHYYAKGKEKEGDIL